MLDADRVNDATHWLATFEREFPDAAHRAFGLPVAPDPSAWAGFACEAEETLISDAVPRHVPCPDGYVARGMAEADWDAYPPFELAENARTREHDPAIHTDLIARRVVARKALEASGVARFFGAFVGDELVAHLGIVACPPVLGRAGLARYQSVGTAFAHRRRGLASHLVGLAGAWAAEQGATTWVICTETTNSAGRFYRRAGFVPDAVGYGAERYPGADAP